MNFMISNAQIFLDKISVTADSHQVYDDTLSLVELVHHWKSFNFKSGSVVLVLLNNSKALLKNVFAILLSGYVPALAAPSTPSGRINMLASSFNVKAILKPNLIDSKIDNIVNLIPIDCNYLSVLNNSSTLMTEAGDFILTTSGTSGFSSGCVFDFQSLVNNAVKHADVINLKEEDNVLVNLPLYYSYAFVAQALASLVRNARLVISSPPFSCSRYLNDIVTHSITISSITPLLVKEMIKTNITFPSCLRTLTVGGDTIDKQHIEYLLDTKSIKELYITYGITEAGPRVSTLAAHAVSRDKLSSVGTLLPGTISHIEAIDGIDTHGELLIHSDTLAKKRLGNAIKPFLVEMNGINWLKTGDLFSIDSDGYLFYKHRSSDFIVLSGEKVNLASIKNLVSLKFGALSTKIKLIYDSNEVSGYELDVIVHNSFDNDIEEISKNIRKELKIFERPKNIEISVFDEKMVDRYK